MPAGGLAGRTAAALLLCFGLAVVQAITPKYACPITDRYCQLQAKYAFASAVIGNQVFYHGGLDANDADKPTNGTTIEMIDLTTLTPYMLPVQPAYALNASRYRHQLVNWRSKLVAVGGQADDQDGESRKVLSVIELDMATRQWELKRQFTQQRSSELIFEQSYIVNDTLYFIVQSLNEQSQSRLFYSLDLPTNKLSPGVPLCGEACFFKYQLSAAAVLNTGVYLTLQSLRAATPGNDTMVFLATAPESETGFLGDFPLAYQFTSPLTSTPGGSGGGVLLNLNMLSFPGLPPILVLWVSTKANFGRSGPSVPVSAVAVYALEHSATLSVTASMQKLYVAVPTGYRLTDLEKIDLPKHGQVSVTLESREIIEQMPYIGKVDLIGDLDYGNVAITQTPNGFVIRGTSKPEDPSCLPGDWKPFVMKFPMLADKPQVTAVSNYTTCSVSKQVRHLGLIRDDNFRAQAHRHLYAINGPTGQRVLQFAPQGYQGEMFSTYYNAPMHGAFLDVTAATPEKMVTQFNITAGINYKFPIEMASCMTQVGGVDTYVEYGGISRLDAAEDAPISDVSLMSVTFNGVNMKIAPVSAALPARTAAAVGCGMDGRVYAFGGLQPTGKNDSYNATVYKPTAGFNTIRFPGGAVKALSAKGPAPRHSHAMTYLNPELVSALGMKQGALLLYGGSNSSYPDLVGLWTINTNILKTMLLGDTWLYDIAADKWQELVLAPGSTTPPKMMWQVMTVHDKQVMMYGGRGYDPENQQWRQFRDIYILDFSLPTQPRWRVATVVNSGRLSTQRTLYPNPGIVPLPQIDSLLLQSDQATSIVVIPRSVQTDGSQEQWDAYNRVLSSGDWLRLAPPAGKLQLTTPLLVPGDITVTGISAGDGGRRLLAAPDLQPISVTCSNNTAFVTMSAGAVLENMIISGCKQQAILVKSDPAQPSSDDSTTLQPVALRYITLTRNRGGNGSAVFVTSNAALTMEHCVIKDNTVVNTSDNSTVRFRAIISSGINSSLIVDHSQFSNNQGTVVHFQGTKLYIASSTFLNNNATAKQCTSVIETSGGSLSMQRCSFTENVGRSGAAIRIVSDTSKLKVSQNTIHNTTFTRNIVVSGRVGDDNRLPAADYAHGAGGALFVDTSCTLHLQGATFIANEALYGGAVYLNRDSCARVMENTTFIGNIAAESGGAISMLAPTCDLKWAQLVFQNNQALDGNAGGVFFQPWSSSMPSGSVMLYLTNSTFHSNSGRLGGGIFMLGHAVPDTLQENFMIVTNSTCVNNTAKQGGWLAAVGSGNHVQLVNSTLHRNEAAEQGGAILANGSMSQLNITAATNLTNNHANNMGGAVSATASKVYISNSFLEGNTAGQSLTQPVTNGGGGAVYAGLDALLSFATSTLQNNKARAFGGGIYCNRCSSVNISNSSLADNAAASAGAVMLLLPGSACQISDRTRFSNNKASIQSFAPTARSDDRGLLGVAKLGAIPPVPVAFNRMLASGVTQNTSHSSEMGFSQKDAGDVGLSEMDAGGAVLIRTAGAVVRIDNSTFDKNTAAIGGALMVYNAACSTPCLQIRQTQFSNNKAARGAGGAILVADKKLMMWTPDCSQAGVCLNNTPDVLASNSFKLVPVTASQVEIASDQDFDVIRVRVTDSNGTSINMTSANFKVQAQLLWDTTPEVPKLLGEAVTINQDGIAEFKELRMLGNPGNYTLQFAATNNRSMQWLQSGKVQITVRDCVAGEVRVNTSRIARCVPCPFPQYSFRALSADNTEKCKTCDATIHATCNRSMVLPQDYYWQSHPRSSQVHACLLPKACQRSPKATQQLQALAYSLSSYSSDDVPVEAAKQYTDLLCSEGYTGVLCGACSKGYGRRGASCYTCYSQHVNGLLYFLVCLYLSGLVAFAACMHIKGVQRRAQLLAKQQNQQIQTPTHAMIQLANSVESQQSCPQTAEIDDAVSSIDLLSVKPSNPDEHQQSCQQHRPELRIELTTCHTSSTDLDATQTELHADNLPQRYSQHPGTTGLVSSQRPSADIAGADQDAVEYQGHVDQRTPCQSFKSFCSHDYGQPGSQPSGDSAAAGPRKGKLPAPAPETAPSSLPQTQQQQDAVFWVAQLLKILVSHLQMLGLLKNLHIKWPWVVQSLLIFLDQTQTSITWVPIDCNFSSNGSLRPVVIKVIIQLLFPTVALLAGGLFWAAYAAVVYYYRRRWLSWSHTLQPYFVLTAILICFYLYPPVTNVIISLFSCTTVDRPIDRSVDNATKSWGEHPAAIGQFWNSDTALKCFTAKGPHRALVYGLGIPGLILFAVGFPVTLALLLYANRTKLNDAKVDLMYGFLYESYRPKYYFWEAIILLEKLCLAICVTLLQQHTAAVQVLLAMAVIFVASVAQVVCHPHCCRMLEILQRSSLYVLQATLFLLMFSALDDAVNEAAQKACLVLLVLANLGLVGAFVVCFVMEGRRMLLYMFDKPEQGSIGWTDIRGVIMPAVHRLSTRCCQCLEGIGTGVGSSPRKRASHTAV